MCPLIEFNYNLAELANRVFILATKKSIGAK